MSNIKHILEGIFFFWKMDKFNKFSTRRETGHLCSKFRGKEEVLNPASNCFSSQQDHHLKKKGLLSPLYGVDIE